MLDEPSMGLAPAIVDSIFDRIQLIHRGEQGLTILLVEQRVAEALELCDRGLMLETGNMVLEGPHDTLVTNAQVRRAYLRECNTPSTTKAGFGHQGRSMAKTSSGSLAKPLICFTAAILTFAGCGLADCRGANAGRSRWRSR